MEDIQEKEAEHQQNERWLDEAEEDLKAPVLRGWRVREKDVKE